MPISIDIEKAAVQTAKANNLPESMFLAFVEVESNGSPFEKDGRTPRFLFERHKFYEELQKLAPDRLEEAITNGLAVKGWQRETQYRDLGTSTGRMKVLEMARAIHPECANRACSWGLGQIMGFNAESLGYASASAMVQSMGTVAGQLNAMVRFLKSRKLDDELRRKDYEGLARGYNGAAYKKNNYHTKLEAAEKQWEIKLGEVTADEVEVPLPQAPVQNAETSVMDVLKKPEIIAAAGTVASGTASTVSASTGMPIPIQYALAAIMVIAALVGAYYIVKRIREE